MEIAIDDLMAKIKVIAKGPNADLLRKFVDILYKPESSYVIDVDILRDTTSKLKAIRDISKTIESQRDKLGEGEVFDLVGRIDAAARMALDYLNDPILHETD